MCGRVAQYRGPMEYASLLKIDWTKSLPRELPNTPPHYNGAPGQDYLIARSHPETHDTTLDLIRWGLLPSWAKDQKIAWKLINARAETVASTPAFKTAFAKRRCLVPVDGFYEWKKAGEEKHPYLIGMATGEPFTLAGLWENWKDPATGEWIRTFTIITTDANELVSELHDRMPVVIGPEDRNLWLNGEDPQELQALLRPFPSELMTMRPVSMKVNSPKNDNPDLLAPVDDDDPVRDRGSGVERANEGVPERKPANSE
jgi:putative SOS response-associated peptidase YedK